MAGSAYNNSKGGCYRQTVSSSVWVKEVTALLEQGRLLLLCYLQKQTNNANEDQAELEQL